jgi:hypothetical protein
MRRPRSRIRSPESFSLQPSRRCHGEAGQAANSLLYPAASEAHGGADVAQVAQLVEHATENRSVGGSIPPLGTIIPLAVDGAELTVQDRREKLETATLMPCQG